MNAKNYLNKLIESLVNKDTDSAEKYFNQYATLKSSLILSEDHEDFMTSKELSAHLKKLIKKANHEQKEKALKHLGIKTCEDDELDACAEKMCKKGKKHCDKVIHALEDIVK